MTPIYAKEISRTGGRPIPIVSVHGTGGSGADELKHALEHKDKIQFDALLICPQFQTPYQFLLPDADRRLLDFVDGEVGLDARMLMRGFSGGGQFAHRFAFRHPHRVAACSALGNGAYTLPDGELIGMMAEDPSWFDKPEFADPAIRRAGEQPARDGWETIRWQTGCGTRDLPSRVRSAAVFADALEAGGASVERLSWDAEHDPSNVADDVWAFLTRGSG